MRAVRTILAAVAVMLIGLSVYVHFKIGFWGDQDWELLVAHTLLAGKKLYVDQFPVNPPLIFYLYTLPAALAQYVPFVQDYQALVLLGLCAIALVIALCVRLITLHPAFAGNRRKQTEFVLLLCFLLIFRIASAFFGDREHIFLVLTFPYLLRWMPSLGRIPLSLRFRVLIGLLAGIGFFIKPHCLLLFAGLQLICLLRKDRPRILFSIENCIIYAFGALYLLGIWVFTPGYFTLALPMELLTYSAISACSGGLFDFTVFITLFLTFLMFRPRQTSPYRKDLWYFLEASVFLVLYGLLNSGWGYTYQPLITLLLFINGWVLWEFLYLGKERPLQACAGAGLCSLNFASKIYVVLLYIFAVFSQGCYGDKACPGYYKTFTDELKAQPEAHSFGMIGMDFALWARVSKLSGAQWVTRFPQLWMIPKFIISDEDFARAHAWVLYDVAGALAYDLQQKKPDIVFVDSSDTIYTIRLEKPYDWLAGFSHFPDFEEAWKHYTYAHTIDSCDAVSPALAVGYVMMKRTPANISNCRYDVYRRIQ